MTKDKQLEAEKKNSIPQNQSKLAKDLLKIIAESDVRLGDRLSVDEEHIKYKEATLKMIKLMFNKDVDLLEVEILFQLMLQAISVFRGTVMGSIEVSQNQALKKFWGKHPDELTMQDIEKKLKEDCYTYNMYKCIECGVQDDKRIEKCSVCGGEIKKIEGKTRKDFKRG